MKPLRIGVDLDGVLVNFDRGWIKHIAKHTGKNIVLPPEGPTRWDWDLAGGVTKAEEVMLWQKANADPFFWDNLRPLPEATYALDKFDIFSRTGTLEVFFITHRASASARIQSERWLHRWGMLFPNVILATGAKHKAQLAKTLELNAFIDDKLENIEEVAKLGTVETFVKDVPHNRKAKADHRVANVRVFADAIAAQLVERNANRK